MNKYINLDSKNIDNEHICCAIGDPKHQEGVDKKKEWIKKKLKDGHVFRRLDARGKIFIEYEPLERLGFQLVVKTMSIFIAYGLLEVLRIKELVESY